MQLQNSIQMALSTHPRQDSMSCALGRRGIIFTQTQTFELLMYDVLRMYFYNRTIFGKEENQKWNKK